MNYINNIICGNCLDILPKIKNNSIDFIFADPQYNRNRNEVYNNEINDNLNLKDYYNWCKKWIYLCFLKLKDTGNFLIMNEVHHIGKLMKIMKNFGKYRNLIIWDKKLPTLTKKGCYSNRIRPILFYSKTENNYSKNFTLYDTDLIENIPKLVGGYLTPKEVILNDNNEFEHKFQLPEQLLIKLISDLCPMNGITLDPFLGSGTTIIASYYLGINYIGIEIVDKYCNMVKERINNIRTIKNKNQFKQKEMF